MEINYRKLNKLFKLLDSLQRKASNFQTTPQKGRKSKLDDWQIIKIAIVMRLTETMTVKGIWQLLQNDTQLAKALGFNNDLPDRTTFLRNFKKFEISDPDSNS